MSERNTKDIVWECVAYEDLGVKCEYSVFVATCCGVREGEARFGLSQLVEVMEADYVGHLKMALWVLVTLPASSYFVVKLRGGEGSQVGRVGTRDAHSITWQSQDQEKRKEKVIQDERKHGK